MIITIDGPAGAGKTTIAEILAKKIGFLHINSGMVYRAMTYYGLKTFTFDLPNKTDELAKHCTAEPEILTLEWSKGVNYIKLNGKRLTYELKDKRITDMVGHVASNPNCRAVVKEKLSKLAIEKNLVVDGRDIGSKVFPWAEMKIFLDATIEERAQRRAQELGVRAGTEKFESLLRNIKKRDDADRNRDIAPLVIPQDSLYINTTDKNIQQIIDEITLKGDLKTI